MKHSFNACLLVLISLFWSCANGDTKPMNTFYIPFQAQTFEPVTEDTIENRFRKKFLMSEADPLLKLIIRIHEDGKSSVLDKNNIRLKYKNNNHVILIDSSGAVSVNGVSRDCSKERLFEVEVMIREK